MRVTYLQTLPSRVGEKIQRIHLEDGEVMRMERSPKHYCRVGNTLYVIWGHERAWGRSVLQPWDGPSARHIPHIGEIINYEGKIPT